MNDKIETSSRIYVEDVICEYWRPGKGYPDNTEKVIAFGVCSRTGKIIGITETQEGVEDFCERQKPESELVYRGKS